MKGSIAGYFDPRPTNRNFPYKKVTRNALLSVIKTTLPSLKLPVLFTIAFIYASQFLSAQPARLDPEKWAKELGKKSYTHDKIYTQLDSLLEYADISHGIVFG